MAPSDHNKHLYKMLNTRLPAVLTGACECGAIRYRCTTAPLYAASCRCRDCQKITASPAYSVVAIPSGSFCFTTASPRYFHNNRADGSLMSRGFCPECGSQLISYMPDYPELTLVSAQSLDEPKWFREANRLAGQSNHSNHSWCGFWPQLSQASTGGQTAILTTTTLQ